MLETPVIRAYERVNTAALHVRHALPRTCLPDPQILPRSSPLTTTGKSAPVGLLGTKRRLPQEHGFEEGGRATIPWRRAKDFDSHPRAQALCQPYDRKATSANLLRVKEAPGTTLIGSMNKVRSAPNAAAPVCVHPYS